MDLLKLERMIAIYEAGSFRKAARDLGISQPTLTWSIHQLEESFNGRLFERGPRGVVPTELCDRLVQRARLIFREQERMLDEVAASTRSQTINLGVHSIFLTDEFAECIAEFSKRWPTVTLQVREGFSADLIERLSRGELDLACCTLARNPDEDSQLVMDSQAELTYSVIASPNHPIFDEIAQGTAIGAYPWAEFDVARLGAFPGENDIQAVLDSVGFSVARRSVRTTSMNLIKLLVTSGNFIGLIADERVAAELEDGALKRLPGTQVKASNFGIVSLKDDLETKAVRALKEVLKSRAFEPLKRLVALS